MGGGGGWGQRVGCGGRWRGPPSDQREPRDATKEGDRVFFPVVWWWRHRLGGVPGGPEPATAWAGAGGRPPGGSTPVPTSSGARLESLICESKRDRSSGSPQNGETPDPLGPGARLTVGGSDGQYLGGLAHLGDQTGCGLGREAGLHLRQLG